MAKRRKTATRTTTKIVRVPAPRAAAPIVVKTTAAPVKRRRQGGGRRRSVGGGGGRVLNGKVIGGVILGGALLGWLEKNYGAKFPSVPFVGTKGTIAAIAYFANKQGYLREITADICIAAGATAGYQLGKEGKISGDVDGDNVYGEVVPQVGAVAAQV